MVDTGVGFDSPLIDGLYRPRRTLLDDALAARGVALDHVVTVVNSHLHVDHCGQNPRLHGGAARFVVQRAEVATVEADPSYTVSSWALGPDRSRWLVDGDEEVADGVTVLATPGHTQGHQSVLVEGGGRRVVIGAQVVWHAEEYDAEAASEANVDPDEGLRRAAVDSIRRIKALGPEVVHFSHCPAASADSGKDGRP